MCSIMCYTSNEISEDEFEYHFNKTISRGPDMSKIVSLKSGILGFHRLAIMDLSPEGMQPFVFEDDYVICNGELYGYRNMKKKLEERGYTFRSESDCEILLPLYNIYGFKMFNILDAEFALIIYDSKKNKYIAARDPIGIRPLYYGYSKSGKIIFASEPKNLIGLTNKIHPFPPGYYFDGEKFVLYCDVTKVNKVCTDNLNTVCKNIHDKLVAGIEKRLDADAPLGFLLSGGLDSSLVCAVAQKFFKDKKIKTYAIGMAEDAIDLKYAKEVADYIMSDHHEIVISKEDVLNSLEEVIYMIGSYDITTIRASIGMFLVCKSIRSSSNIRVLLTGEVSDELFGYKYTDFAPNAIEFQEESIKRIREIHMYDVLRADRCICNNSMESRVPFGDLDFVKYVMSICPEMKMNKFNKGKYLLRRAFEGDYLPTSILYREKAAFSDAVGHSMVDYLKEFAKQKYSDTELIKGCKKYSYHATPFTKEALLYRDIFEKYYHGQAEMVLDYWMPNKEWKGCNVNDPSARVLSNYGNSAV